MKQNCKICTTRFDYCGPCSLMKNPLKNAGYCCENCYHISMILQEYGSHVISAEEALMQLQAYDVDNMDLQPKIADFYNNIKKALKPTKKAKLFKQAPIVEAEAEIIEDINPKDEIPYEEDTSSFSTEAYTDKDMETTPDFE